MSTWTHNGLLNGYAIKRARVESANYIGRGGLHIYILFSCDGPFYLKLVLGPL